MIDLNCTNCNKVLSIDDAFAGGVCRCQYCGTIQTVPAKGQHAASHSAITAADASTPKSLYKRKARIESALSPFNDALDEAADLIPSSGLSNSILVSGVHRKPSAVSEVPLSSQVPMSGMGQSNDGGGLANPPVVDTASLAARHAAHHPAVVAQTHASRRLLVIAAAGGVLAIALAGTAGWLLRNPGEASDAGASSAATKPAATAPAIKAEAAPETPQLAGISLAGRSIVYVLDRSGCSNETFGEMIRVCGQSLSSLGSGRQFRVLVMDADKLIAYPPDAPGEAAVGSREAFLDAFSTEVYVGQKNAAAVFQQALENRGDSLVLISANDDQATLFETLSPVLGEKPQPVQVFYVGVSDSNPGLQQLAQATGGGYHKFNLADIKK